MGQADRRKEESGKARLPAPIRSFAVVVVGSALLLDLVPCAILVKLKTNGCGRQGLAQTTMTVRVGGALAEFVASNVGENGRYENVSEYIRDLIRRDKERVEREAFERLKAELQHAFAAADDTFEPLTAADVIARNRR